MGKLDTEVKKLIETKYPGATADLEFNPRTSRVVGSVIYDGFANMEHIDRQSTVRSYLRDELGDQFGEVGLLFLYTRNEIEHMRAA
jgi:acid stress-induced BolA-like protein IbaG/YrbA